MGSSVRNVWKSFVSAEYGERDVRQWRKWLAEDSWKGFRESPLKNIRKRTEASEM